MLNTSQEIIELMLELGRDWGYEWDRADLEEFVSSRQIELKEFRK